MDRVRSHHAHRRLSKQALALLALAAAACSYQLEGPTPVVQGLDPSVVCSEQLTTPASINGDGLSPMAEEALTEDPLLALPAVTLTRTRDLGGNAVTGTAKAIPDDPRNPSASHVEWRSITSPSAWTVASSSVMPDARPLVAKIFRAARGE